MSINKGILDKQLPIDMDCAGDAEGSTASIRNELFALQDRLREVSADGDEQTRISLLLDIASLQLQMGQSDEAWDNGHTAFKLSAETENWEFAAQACEIIFSADKHDTLPALGMGVWLGVTYPIDPQISIALLEHIVDETPADSDGGAVAAATAYYLADLRGQGKSREDLLFYASQLMARVARRHSNVEGQDMFDAWVERMELNNPARFLPHLRNVVDVLVQDDWWFDRDALQAKLPVN